MISFRSTEEELTFIQVAKNLAKEKIRPIARLSEEEGRVNEAFIQKVSELGLLSMDLPENWGGLQLPLISQVQILQALSYGDLGVIQGLRGLGDFTNLLSLLADNPILTSYKEELLENGRTVAVVDIEHGDQNIKLTEQGNYYVVNGTSHPVRFAKFADFVAVAGNNSEGQTVILWLDSNNGNQWGVEEGDYRLGLLCSGLASLTFNNLKVAKDQVLVSGEKATEIMAKARVRNRILQAAKEVGLMEAALEYATEYTAKRKAFGQEIAKFQGVSFRIADMAIETKIANHLVWSAALKADEDESSADHYSLRALYRAHRSLRFVTDSAVQLLGGHGYVQEFPVEKWMRDAQAQTMLYGRERDLLIQYGEHILAEGIEVLNL